MFAVNGCRKRNSFSTSLVVLVLVVVVVMAAVDIHDYLYVCIGDGGGGTKVGDVNEEAWAIKVDKYVDEGMTEKEAKTKASEKLKSQDVKSRH